MNITFPLGDITAEVFLRDYWQKKPLLIRNAIPDFVSPVGADELAGLACEEEVESRLIRFDAVNDEWQMMQGPLDEAVFSELPPSNWTLLIQAVDHWAPQAHELLRRFSFIPNWRIDDLMISYAVDGGGVGPHYDNYDVFLLQASGKRRWEIGGTYDEHAPRREDAPVMILPEWQAEESWVLEPGDMLYLPPRIGHNGVAVGDDCITCSIGFRAPAHHEMLRGFSDFAGERLGHDARYCDPDLPLQQDPGEITAAALDKARQELLDILQDRELFAAWFGEFVTEPKYPELAAEPDDAVSEEELVAFLNDDGCLYPSEGCRLAWMDQDSKGQDSLDQTRLLFADGQCYPLTSSAAQALASRLGHYLSISLADLEDVADAQSLHLLCELLKRGLLHAGNDEEVDSAFE
ncbi:JmjC domain-containing protein [Nitrincola sp. MINF-07-Sa-05]|uniref:JmjC domain-containing protein n=1 Tax=Nitrincola salilacus TaxID=3400273 RepID=UPI003917C40F